MNTHCRWDNIPSGNFLIANEHGPVELVDFPIKNGGSFHLLLGGAITVLKMMDFVNEKGDIPYMKLKNV